MRMSREDILAQEAFDFCYDEGGNLFTRTEGTAFKRQHAKVNARRPLWAVVEFLCAAGADVSIEIQSWKFDSVGSTSAIEIIGVMPERMTPPASPNLPNFSAQVRNCPKVRRIFQR